MADQSLDILINFIRGQHGEEEAQRALAKLREETHKSGKKVEEHNKHSREMHLIFHKLNEIVPGLGNAMKAALHPDMIGTLGIITALTVVVELVKKWREETKKLREEQAEQEAVMKIAVWEAQAKAIRDTLAAADSYSDSIVKATTNLNAFKEAEESAMKAIQAHYDMMKKLAGDDKLQAEQVDRDQEKAKIKRLERNREEAIQKRWDAQADLEAAKKASAGIAGSPGAELATEAGVRLPKDKEAVKKAQKEFDEAQKVLEYAKSIGVEHPAAAEKRFQDAATALASAKLSQQADEEAIAQHERAVKHLTEVQKSAEEAVTNYIKTITEATKALEDAKQAAALAQHTQDALELQKAGLKPESVAGGSVLNVIRIMEAAGRTIAATGKAAPLSPTDAQAIVELQRSFGLQGVSSSKQQELFKEMGDLHADHIKKLNDVLAVLKVLKAQQATQGRNATN